MGIVALASIRELGPQEQLLIKDPTGFYVINGPFRDVVITHYGVEHRYALVLQAEQYAVVKDELNGQFRDIDGPQRFFLNPYDKLERISNKVVLHKEQYAVLKSGLTGEPRHESGPQLLHPGIYDTVEEVRPKIVLEKDQYIRLVDEVTGSERVVRGPWTFVPNPLEGAPNGTERTLYLDTDLAALVLNRSTGQQHLVTAKGSYAPGPYEEILEVRPLVHVLPHEAVIVRDALGQLEVHSGADGVGGAGTSFFLPPYCQILAMVWSDYSDTDHSTVEKSTVQKIDMRSRHIFFKYEVRTSDNVKLILEGTVFWKITNVSKMIQATPDPEGDVWHHARSALIEAVSNTTLADFMAGFNNIIMDSFHRQAADGFYQDRGVVLESMGLTGFDCADSDTAKILQEIIQETTNRMNRLTAQQSENDVKAAELTADIKLEKQRTELIRTQAENDRLKAQMNGEATGMEMVRGAAAFIDGLNESVPSVDKRVELYQMHEEMKGRNQDTRNLASGKASLFLTPSDLNLRLDTRSSPETATSSSPEL